MDVSIIVAMNDHRVIGCDGGLPWRQSADLKRFKALTMGSPLIMGRKTYQSIGHPLPDRKNIVLSRTKNFAALGCTIAASFTDALCAAEGADEAFIIGGSSIYAQSLSFANKLYVTEVHANVVGNIYFPDFDRQAWIEVERVMYYADKQNDFNYSFTMLQRKFACNAPVV